MSYSDMQTFLSSGSRPVALILGTNEIASAIAIECLREGYAAVLSHDSFPPVIRRGMAFHDALFGDSAVIDAVAGERAETIVELACITAKSTVVAVAPLHLTELLPMCRPAILIDARMQKHREAPDYRGVTGLTIGVGPNFIAGTNCDVAIETHPASAGAIVEVGATRMADGRSPSLGGREGERFVYSGRSGVWHTAVDVGMRVFRGFVLGHLDGVPIHAPIDGHLRGIARDATPIPSGVKILEIDPRGRRATWTGTDERGRAIAAATAMAIRARARDTVTRDVPTTQLRRRFLEVLS